jgi:hypothetical protein
MLRLSVDKQKRFKLWLIIVDEDESEREEAKSGCDVDKIVSNHREGISIN